MHSQPIYGHKGKFPVTEKLFSRGVCLPSAPTLLDEEINFLQDSLDDLDAELAVNVGAYEKYKELITCYRTALFTWHDLNRRQGLTEQDHLVIRVELRRSLFSCPPM